MKFRDATVEDVPAIVEMLADDPLGATREQFTAPLPEAYLNAFEKIDSDPNNRLIVAIDEEQQVRGCLQLTLIPGLNRLGMTRAQIEGVRVHRELRGAKIGTQFFEYAIEEAQKAGCGLVQLTTDTSRPKAHGFYEKLGFEASHVGMKLKL